MKYKIICSCGHEIIIDVYGDCLSKIMSFAGYDVTREYYINDAGNQMYTHTMPYMHFS